ncbi:MAG: AarF/ABC1/UbiB kinase family protein [Fimbriiglobus sp.]|nr:AarF/ABC1/UbiB kinase family protein [Fimbriiglobus sp.]
MSYNTGMAVNLAQIPQLARNGNRLAEIAGVLAKYGLADWIARLDVRFLNRLMRTTPIRPITDAAPEARVRLALTELGTTFIKLGQMLSTRRDLVGPAQADELSKLQSNAPADPFLVTKATVEAELKKPLAELFATFEEAPLASASIGQVHRATLHDGRAVVVKVQHPNIGPRIDSDLSILTALADVAEKYLAEVRPYKPTAVVAEFGKLLSRELDFRRELRHLQVFARNFATDDTVKFPVPVPSHSTARVLTMERLDGVPLSAQLPAEVEPAVRGELARRGARVFLDMIFRDGFFHADPHPGNVLILPGGVIGLLDAGMVGRVDDALRANIERGMIAVMTRDAVALTDLVMTVGQVPPDLDAAALQAEVADQLTFYWGMPLDQFELSVALDELTEAVRRFHIVMPPGVSLLAKVLVMLEGTGRLLDPAFNLTTVLEQYRGRFTRRRLSPKRMMQKVMSGVRDWEEVLGSLPRMVRDVMRFAREQKFAVQLQHQHLDPSVNRLVFGLLTSALFVGSALLWANKAPPLLWDISVVGAIGVAVSAVLGSRLLWAIQKSGKLEE